jgi:hypothetical protein
VNGNEVDAILHELSRHGRSRRRWTRVHRGAAPRAGATGRGQPSPRHASLTRVLAGHRGSAPRNRCSRVRGLERSASGRSWPRRTDGPRRKPICRSVRARSAGQIPSGSATLLMRRGGR